MKTKQEPFIYRESDFEDHIKEVYDYLHKKRKLSYKTISFFYKNGLIKQDKKGNCCFMWKDEDGKYSGVEKKGIFKKKFIFLQTNSPKNTKGFSIKIGKKSNDYYFFESAIDLMSFYEMENRKLLKNGANLISMSGLKQSCIKQNIEGKKDVNIFLCTDNDKAGILFDKRIQENKEYRNIKISILKAEKTLKDFNDELKKKDVRRYEKVF